MNEPYLNQALFYISEIYEIFDTSVRTPGGATVAVTAAAAAAAVATPLETNTKQQTTTLLADTPINSLKQLCKDIKAILNDGELVIIEKKFQKIRFYYYQVIIRKICVFTNSHHILYILLYYDPIIIIKSLKMHRLTGLRLLSSSAYNINTLYNEFFSSDLSSRKQFTSYFQDTNNKNYFSVCRVFELYCLRSLSFLHGSSKHPEWIASQVRLYLFKTLESFIAAFYVIYSILCITIFNFNNKIHITEHIN